MTAPGEATPPSPGAVLEGLLDEAARRGVVAEVSVRRRRQRVLRARAGAVDTATETAATTTWLRVWAHGSEATLTVPGAADPRETVDLARALARRLPPRRPLEPPSGLDAPPAQPAGAPPLEPPSGLAAPPTGAEPEAADRLDAVAGRLASLAAHEGEEVWLQEHDDHLWFGRTGAGSVAHRRRLASANVRVVTGGQHGRAHSSHGTGAASAGSLLDGPLPSTLERARAEARALASLPPAGDLPATVTLSPLVAAALLSLAVHGFLADAVVERHSMLADRLGEQVAAPDVTLVDDAGLPGAPLQAAVDDEGSRTAATTLVERGRLRAYLGDRRAAERLDGQAPGAGWAPDGDTPAPAPSNLCLLPDPGVGDRPVAARADALEIVQSHGMHLANPVTGDFSFGGAGIVRSGGEAVAAVPHLTVAGNVYDLLRDVRAVGGDLRFVVTSSAFGCPSLEVEGLSVGR